MRPKNILYDSSGVCLCRAASSRITQKYLVWKLKKFWNSRNLACPFMIKVAVRFNVKTNLFLSPFFSQQLAHVVIIIVLKTLKHLCCNKIRRRVHYETFDFRFSKFANVINSEIYRFLTIWITYLVDPILFCARIIPLTFPACLFQESVLVCTAAQISSTLACPSS